MASRGRPQEARNNGLKYPPASMLLELSRLLGCWVGKGKVRTGKETKSHDAKIVRECKRKIE